MGMMPITNNLMEKLNLKPTHKPIKDYYKALEQYDQYDLTHEGTVSNPFRDLT